MFQIIGAFFTWQFWFGALLAGILMFIFKKFIVSKIKEFERKNIRR